VYASHFGLVKVQVRRLGDKKQGTQKRDREGENNTESRVQLMVHVCQFARNNLQANSISETCRGLGGISQ